MNPDDGVVFVRTEHFRYSVKNNTYYPLNQPKTQPGFVISVPSKRIIWHSRKHDGVPEYYDYTTPGGDQPGSYEWRRVLPHTTIIYRLDTTVQPAKLQKYREGEDQPRGYELYVPY